MDDAWFNNYPTNGLTGKKVNQNITIEQTSTPTLTIVSSTEMKNYLKVDGSTDDTLINGLTLAAQKIIERQLGDTPLIETDFTQRQKGGIEHIKLMRQPVNGVPTVSYYEYFDTTTATNITYSSYFKKVNNTLIHSDGYFVEGRDHDGYEISFKAGKYTASSYSSADEGLKTAVQRIVGYLYENREEGLTDLKEANWTAKYNWDKDPVGVKYLLMPYHSGEGII
jgi:uncharacterized phiE125 gp8 family phage protein